jgi:hypothetical protein
MASASALSCCLENAVNLIKSGATISAAIYAAMQHCLFTGQMLHKFVRLCTSRMQF